MAEKKSRYHARNIAVSTLFASLLLGFLNPISADAVVLVRPATQWGHVYAGPATTDTQQRKPKVANLEKKSVLFERIYFDFKMSIYILVLIYVSM